MGELYEAVSLAVLRQKQADPIFSAAVAGTADELVDVTDTLWREYFPNFEDEILKKVFLMIFLEKVRERLLSD